MDISRGLRYWRLFTVSRFDCLHTIGTCCWTFLIATIQYYDLVKLSTDANLRIQMMPVTPRWSLVKAGEWREGREGRRWSRTRGTGRRTAWTWGTPTTSSEGRVRPQSTTLAQMMSRSGRQFCWLFLIHKTRDSSPFPYPCIKHPFECLPNPEEWERNWATNKVLTLAGPCHPPAWLFVPGRRTGKAQRGSLSSMWSYVWNIQEGHLLHYL